MTETALPPSVDLGSEAAVAMQDYALVIIVLALALGFLLRGVLRRRAAGGGCAGCSSCGRSGSCPMIKIPSPNDPV